MEVDEDVAYLGLLAGDLDEAAWIAEQAEQDLALRQCARSGSADECGKESERKQQATRDHKTAIRRKPHDPEHRPRALWQATLTRGTEMQSRTPPPAA
jgi:hypothetical protein